MSAESGLSDQRLSPWQRIMFTLRHLLEPCSIRQLMTFADYLDPNHSWDEWIESTLVSELDVLNAMVQAYGEEDHLMWALSNPRVLAILKG